ncbi:MFS general substrate transporter [Mytilinidion resinicola]|uniref:MFS general substrate transporter n=1 Tax=Mytilinidion resinicola TaxID=574789 RepID=A0A6A6Z013_9PEZI|nr:MFS general substrate transporter [Mytilinidion resinicola]KAF2814421.1 MFS general substrate transporter [Mytilinidion resinicola]
MPETPFGSPARRSEIIELAALEGHDADVPSNVGFIEEHEKAHHRKHLPEAANSTDVDLEKDLEKNGDTASLSSEDDVAGEAAAEAEDPNVVWWDGPTDPENPLNWSFFKKWGTVGIVSALTFLTPLASSAFAPGVPEVMAEFHSTSQLLESFMVSVYVLGFAFGPLIFAPLSEMYGRLPIYHICNILFIIFTVAAAVSTNMSMFVVFRFFMGSAGGAPLALGGGTIADLISREQRGTAMAIWLLGPTMGPCIGPIIGGFLTQAKGWRWNFWLIAILTGGFACISFVLMRETSAPVILARKAKRLRKETGNPNLRSKLESKLSGKELFWLSIIRPTKMLTRSWICFLISLYVAITYAYLYILFTTFTSVFEQQYGFSGSVVGLSFLGLGIGSLSGQFVFTWAGNKTATKHIKAGDFKAEHRLEIMLPGGFFIPIGLFWYGWSVQAGVHWIVPILGTFFVGFGLLLTFMPANTYLVEVFTVHAASAMAANTVLRSIAASLLPLSSQQMYKALGYGWGNSLLGFVSLALIPIPFIFRKYGERIRKSSKAIA